MARFLNSNLTRLDFISYQPIIDNNYATGTIDCYVLGGKISFLLHIQVTKTIPKWTQIVSDMPNTTDAFTIKNIIGEVSLQYHPNGFLQSTSVGLETGSYVFVL